jgi:hypothetical protein
MWNYRAIKLLPDATAGATPALTQRWMGALTWRFAYWLAHAFSLPDTKRRELKAQADEEESIVMGQENERGPLCFTLSSPYRGGSYR